MIPILPLVVLTAKMLWAEAPADPCARIAQDYGVLSRSSGKPCAAFPGDAACDETRRWAALQDAYVRHFSSRGDALSREVGGFLKQHPRFLIAGNDHVDDSVSIWTGTYRSDLDAIVLDESLLAPFWASVPPGGDVTSAAVRFVDDTAPVMVHEVTHALAAREAGGAEPENDESELLAYARQAAYLRSRLAEDPSYEGVSILERGLARVSSSTVPAGGWWRRPLLAADFGAVKPAVVAVRKTSAGRVTFNTTNDWFLVRFFAGGLDNFRTALRMGHSLTSRGSLSSLGEKDRLERADNIARQIATDERCELTAASDVKITYRRDARVLRLMERLLRSRRRFENLKRFYHEQLSAVARSAESP